MLWLWLWCCRAGEFLTRHSSRLTAMAFWFALLFVVMKFAPTSQTSQLPNIVVRKFFHIVAVVMFTPVILTDVRWLFAVCCACDCV